MLSPIRKSLASWKTWHLNKVVIVFIDIIIVVVVVDVLGKVLIRLTSLLHAFYIEDITRWFEDMKFIFEWRKYFKSERSSLVKYFFHEKMNFISSNQRVIFFLLHRCECFEN